jgi:hypothetical protein
MSQTGLTVEARAIMIITIEMIYNECMIHWWVLYYVIQPVVPTECAPGQFFSSHLIHDEAYRLCRYYIAFLCCVSV